MSRGRNREHRSPGRQTEVDVTELAGRAGGAIQEQITSIADAAALHASEIERRAGEASEARAREVQVTADRVLEQISGVQVELANILGTVSSEGDYLRARLERFQLTAGHQTSRLPAGPSLTDSADFEKAIEAPREAVTTSAEEAPADPEPVKDQAATVEAPVENGTDERDPGSDERRKKTDSAEDEEPETSEGDEGAVEDAAVEPESQAAQASIQPDAEAPDEADAMAKPSDEETGTGFDGPSSSRSSAATMGINTELESSDEARVNAATKPDVELAEAFETARSRLKGMDADSEDGKYWSAVSQAIVDEAVGRATFGELSDEERRGSRRQKRQRERSLRGLKAAREQAVQSGSGPETTSGGA